MNRLSQFVATLHPAYFAMVMATGIVSTDAFVLGKANLGLALFGVNLVAYVVLWVASIARVARSPRRVLADLLDHGRGPGFFTVVAATCVLGSQLILLFEAYRPALALWLLGLSLWIGLTYTIFTGLTIKETKPSLADGISGAWLLAVVSTQSVALLSAQLALHLGPYKLAMNFFALSMWLWGGMLYIWMISLIFYRYTFFPFKPSDLAPPYWINMGAMAISTLAGATLLLAVKDRDAGSALVRDLLPFIKGATLLFWATATWWNPMLLILGVWRHIVKRFPLRYDPLYFGAVFPLGMYSVATARMGGEGGAIDLPPFLSVLPSVFCYVSLAAWALAVAGMGYTVVVGARVRK